MAIRIHIPAEEPVQPEFKSEGVWPGICLLAAFAGLTAWAWGPPVTAFVHGLLP